MGRRKLVLTISHRRPRDYRCLNLFQSITKRCPILELNYFVFEKHVIKRTSKTNIRTLRLCVRFKYASFYRRFQSFQSLFGSLFSLVSIAVWTYFNRLQNTGAKLFRIWNVLSAAFFWHPLIPFVFCFLSLLCYD